MIQVDADRFHGHRRTLYSPGWDRLEARYEKYELAPHVARPGRLSTMLAIAEALGSGVDFVRVDLYCVDDRIVFGELTNYPEAGYAPFVPPGFDRQVGEWWAVPRKWGG